MTLNIWSVVYERPDTAATGFGRAVWALSKVFASRANVHVVYEVPGGSGLSKEVVDNICLYGVPSRHGLIAGRTSFYKCAANLIETLADKHDSNIMFLHGSFSLPLVLPLKKLGPVVYHTFGTLLVEFVSSAKEVMRTRDKDKLLRYASDMLIESMMVRDVDTVVVPHGNAALEFVRIYRVSPSKTVVSPYGQDIYERFHDNQFLGDVERFRAQFAGKKIILFVGGYAWGRKGASQMLNAFAEISKLVPSVMLMTGKPDQLHLGILRELNAEKRNLVLLGIVDDRELATMYAACDVFVLPSLHEGFSQPVIEVMAYGKPIVASPLAAYPSVRDGIEGFIVNPYDIDAISESVVKLMRNDVLYRFMSNNARKRADQFTWSKAGNKLLAFFLSLARGRDGRSV